MAKNNIRSIRLSDEIVDLIDRQVGDTFTQKFENLVTRCVWELPGVEAELAKVETQIAAKQQELQKIQKIINSLKTLERTIKVAEDYVNEVAKMSKYISIQTQTQDK